VHNQIDHIFPIKKEKRIVLSDKINWKKAAPSNQRKRENKGGKYNNLLLIDVRRLPVRLTISEQQTQTESALGASSSSARLAR
jgi:hypothetical protein